MSNPQVVNVISCGRTGSTLLMGILNSIDGYMIRGENLQIFHKLFEFNQLANRLKTETKTHPWFNDHSIDNINQNIKRLFFDFLDQKRTHRVVGFKEIRYAFGEFKHQRGELPLSPLSQKEKRDLYKYLDFLHELTDCKFIYNTRDINAIIKSAWWATNDKSRQIIQRFEQIMHHYCKIKKFCFHVSYEDVISQNLKPMFDFLNEKYNPDKINKLLKINH